MSTRPQSFEPQRLLQWLADVPSDHFPAGDVGAISLQIAPQLQAGSGAQLEHLFQTWKAFPEGSPAHTLREAMITGLMLAPEHLKEVNGLLYEASFDKTHVVQLRALQTLGVRDPEMAAIRLRDLASATDTSSRRSALTACANTLQHLKRPTDLALALTQLLQDKRLSIHLRDRASLDLGPYQPQIVDAWRQSMSLPRR